MNLHNAYMYIHGMSILHEIAGFMGQTLKEKPPPCLLDISLS